MITEKREALFTAIESGDDDAVQAISSEISDLQRKKIENGAHGVLKDGIDAATFASVAVSDEVCPEDEAYEIAGRYTATGTPVVIWFE